MHTVRALLCFGVVKYQAIYALQWRHNEHDGVLKHRRLVYSTVCSGTNKKNIKAPRHWPLWGKFTGDRWIPRTKGQWRRKCFHFMTSSWHILQYYLAPWVIWANMNPWKHVLYNQKAYQTRIRISWDTQQFDGFVQDCVISIANTEEMLQSYTKPSTYQGPRCEPGLSASWHKAPWIWHDSPLNNSYRQGTHILYQR